MPSPGSAGASTPSSSGRSPADRFSLFESMSLLMLVVVAGAGYVWGGLTAGLLYGAVFVLLQNVLGTVAEDHAR